MILEINGTPIASGALTFPWRGSWRLEARTEDDPKIQEAIAFSLTADGQPILLGEIHRVTRFGSLVPGQARTRIVCVPTGTRTMGQNLLPQCFMLQTRQQILLALYPQLTFAVPDAQGAEVLPNFVVNSKMTGRKIFNFLFDDYYWDENSVLYTAPRAPAYNQNDYVQLDSGFSDTIDLAVQTQFLLMPGDIWLDYSIKSCRYQLEQSPRILAKILQ